MSKIPAMLSTMIDPEVMARMRAERVADDFFTAGPSYRTRRRLIELVEQAILEGRRDDGEGKDEGRGSGAVRDPDAGGNRHG